MQNPAPQPAPPAHAVPVSERTIGHYSWLADALKAYVASGAGALGVPPINTSPFLEVGGVGFGSLGRSKKINSSTTHNPQSVVNPVHVKEYVSRHLAEFPEADPELVARGFRVTWLQWAMLQVRALCSAFPTPPFITRLIALCLTHVCCSPALPSWSPPPIRARTPICSTAIRRKRS